ncbi:MAG: ribosome rescue GTPase HflX [Pseudomonadota bacterium]
MFERPQVGERALIVHPEFDRGPPACDVHEFVELAVSAGAEVIDTVICRRTQPEARLLIGSGKADEIAARVRTQNIELVLVSHALSPTQERNLEKSFKARVIDRSGLILDIFAQRARSFEGKLQVELAQLRHLSTRLVRGWTHLERQKGGIGLRGPGETQLETDRRLLRDRIAKLRRRLDKVDKQRELGRQRRVRNDVPTVSLVGYTNAGKSTLFNRLTESEVYAADQLFATLDPTLRQWTLDERQSVVLADTVGFVADLPHELVAAFRATLTETREADLLLHVIDSSDPERDQREEQVNDVLKEIGADDVPQIRVYNKIDVEPRLPSLTAANEERGASVFLSAATGAGVDLLLAALRQHFAQDRVRGWMYLGVDEKAARARLFALGSVLEEQFDDDGGSSMNIDLTKKDFLQFCSQSGMMPERLVQSQAQLEDGYGMERIR